MVGGREEFMWKVGVVGSDGRKFSKNVARTDRQNAGMSGTPLWKLRAEAEKKAEEERAAAALFPGEADG